MVDKDSSAIVAATRSDLASPKFYRLAEVPHEAIWLKNIQNEKTRIAYQEDVRQFVNYWQISSTEAFRTVTRAHVIEWRDHLKDTDHSNATICRKLSALSSLCNYLCNENAITANPTVGVQRPKAISRKTSDLKSTDVRAMLDAPDPETIKGLRDRAILSVGFFHSSRRSEIANMKVRDFYMDKGLAFLRFISKGSKSTVIPSNPHTVSRIKDYLEAVGHGDDLDGPLFRPIKNNTTGEMRKPISGTAVYQIFKQYINDLAILGDSLSPHSMRATAITNALEHGVDITKVQEMANHSNIQTTKGYDRRDSKPEDSASYRISY